MWVFRRPEVKGCLNQGVWTRGRITWARGKIFLFCRRSSRCCTKNWLREGWKGCPSEFLLPGFSVVCVQMHTKKRWREKKGREAAWDLVGTNEPFPNIQHLLFFFFFPPNCFWCQACTYWQSYEEQVVVVAYLLVCFVSSLQSIFVNTAPVPQALEIPWCGYLVWQRELGRVSVLCFVHWVQREFFGMQFALGITLITLTSLSKETKRTKPRKRISIKMAFPEVGLSFLKLPCTGYRNASNSLLYERVE